MILPLRLLGVFSCAILADAQYFSEGWKPGQPTTTQAEPSVVPAPRPENPTTPWKGPLTLLSELFDVGNIIKSKPSQDLFSLLGINITERIELASSQNKIWDERIPLITDENYNNMIVNESLSPTEEKERVWFLIITSSTMSNGGLSKLVDENFDIAYNQTVDADDLPHVKWGRIDYLNVTAITTRWNVWHAPFLVVLKDRGQNLRFYRAQHLSIRPEHMREFLRQEGYEHTPPWKSSFGPGGEYENIMKLYANALASLYNISVKLPKWIFYLISGSIGSMIIGFLHRAPAQPVDERTRRVPEPASSNTPVTVTVTAPTTPSKQGSTKQRKGRR